MKSLLVLLAVLSLTACTGIIHPPRHNLIPLNEIPAIGAGRVRPVAIKAGQMEAEREWRGTRSPVGTNRWVIDVGEWSRFFADRLREEYSRRGVDVDAGPEIKVEVTYFKKIKERTSLTRSRIRSRIITDVQVGDRTWTFDAKTDISTKTSAADNMIRLILQREEIQAIVRGQE